ncbi:hypothetical protein D3C80_788960 [compost metagenome]
MHRKAELATSIEQIEPVDYYTGHLNPLSQFQTVQVSRQLNLKFDSLSLNLLGLHMILQFYF